MSADGGATVEPTGVPPTTSVEVAALVVSARWTAAGSLAFATKKDVFVAEGPHWVVRAVPTVKPETPSPGVRFSLLAEGYVDEHAASNNVTVACSTTPASCFRRSNRARSYSVHAQKSFHQLRCEQPTLQDHGLRAHPRGMESRAHLRQRGDA